MADAKPFSDVYRDELLTIARRRKASHDDPSAQFPPDSGNCLQALEKAASEETLRDIQSTALKGDLCGLAISGGGIRSATFGLGVLQGLAATGLLPRFDYLSTVSGGGFIGSWLSTWIYHSGLDKVEAELHPPRLWNSQRVRHVDDRAEPPEVRHLRRYSNYLAPRPGLFSFDGWVLIAIYLRNLLLNQSVLLLAALAVFCFIRAIVELFSLARDDRTASWYWWLITVLNILSGGIALWGSATVTRSGMLKNSMKGRAKQIAEQAKQWQVDCEKEPKWSWCARLLKPLTLWNETERFSLPWFWATCIVPCVFAAMFLSIMFTSAGMLKEDTQLRVWFICSLGAAAVQWAWGVLTFGKRKRWRAGIAGIFSGALAGTLLFLFWWWLIPLTLPKPPQTLIPANNRVQLNIHGENVIISGSDPNAVVDVRGENIILTTPPQAANGQNIIVAAPTPALKPLSMTVAAAATFGVPVTLALIVLANFFQVGFCGGTWMSIDKASSVDLEDEVEREWWSSANSRLMMIGFTWLLLVGGLAYGPWGIGQLWKNSAGGYEYLTGLFSAGWFGSLLAGIKAASSRNTGKSSRPTLLNGLAQLAPPLFFATLWLGLATLSTWLFYDYYALFQLNNNEQLKPLLFHQRLPYLLHDFDYAKYIIHIPAFFWLCGGIIVLYFLATAFGMLIGVNTFSLQNLYKNRLVRCYLRASRPLSERHPDPLVNFDASDDLPLSRLNPASNQKEHRFWGPLHIINAALNQKAGNTATAKGIASASGTEEQAEGYQFLDRKAEAFVFTPAYCGSESTGYCASTEFAGDVRIGTAVAVSGAAVSPNAGYHSSPAVTALLTVFNIRLGSWFGNPRNDATRKQVNPAASLGLLFSELAGITNSESDYIYLSDGGHFDNSGVYELIHRRCRFILAIDAGADPEFHDNIGRLIRQVRIDFGIGIELDATPITPGPDGLCSAHMVVGRIHYGDFHPTGRTDLPPDDPRFSYDDNHGIILWIKNALTGDEAGDICNQKAVHPAFPYDTTVDQFFSESQFESYRYLGTHSLVQSLVLPQVVSGKTRDIVAAACVPGRDALPSTRELFERNYDFWLTKPAKFLEGYIAENIAYATLQATLRDNSKLRWLAIELYGDPALREFARQQNRDADQLLAERLTANQMFTLLENVWLSLDFEHCGRHPVNAGWKGVFDNWVHCNTLKNAWHGDDLPNRTGLKHEYNPSFRRYIEALMDEPWPVTNVIH